MKITNEKWELQLFAEGETNESVEGETNGKPSENSSDGGEHQDEAKKYTDKEVDEIVEKKFQKWKTKHEKELEEAKNEASKLAKMNAEQKKDYEMEKLKQENEEYKRMAAKTELGKEATKILKESKIEATQDILDFVVGDNAENTKANIEKFVSVIDSLLKIAEVERATGRTPKNYNGGTSLSREDIMKIKDPVERQQAIAKNIDMFK